LIKTPSQKEDKEVKTPSQRKEEKIPSQRKEEKTPSQRKEEKTPSQKEEKTPSQRKEVEAIPSPVFKYNVLTKDSNGKIMKGGSNGAFFSNQIPRNIISSLKVHSSGESIKRIAIQFFNKSDEFV